MTFEELRRQRQEAALALWVLKEQERLYRMVAEERKILEAEIEREKQT